MERSLGIKILMGNLPIMMCETAWYPDAYPEPEMQRCPQNHQESPREIPVELQAHFLLCEETDWVPSMAPPLGRPTVTWKHDYVSRREP
ncbi:hypothetical protein IWW45_009492, partial [Coemansia sp. RSA 485]